MPRFLLNLRVQIAILIVLAVVPILALVVYSAAQEREHDYAAAQQRASRLLHTISVEQKNIIDDTRQLLMLLARVSSVRDAGSATCGAFLADVLKQHSDHYTVLFVASPNGDVVCSATPTQVGSNYSDRSYFQRVVQTGEFAIGDFQIGRVTNKPTMGLAYPVLDESGRVRRVLIVGLDLGWVGRLVAAADLPAGGALTIMDSGGIVLARHPDFEQWVGKPVPNAPTPQDILSRGGEGMGSFIGRDGERRLYVFAALQVGEQSAPLYVRAGIPEAVAYAAADEALRRNLVGIGLVLLLGLGASRMLGERMILLPAKALVTTTRRLAAGDLTARTGLFHTHGEVGEVAQAFDQMADTLQERQAEAERARDALLHSEEKYRSLVENARDIIYRCEFDRDVMRPRVVFVSSQIKTILGYDPEEVMQGPDFWLQILHPDDVMTDRSHLQQLAQEKGTIVRTYRVRHKETGEYRWLEDRISAHVDANGKLVGFGGVARDITWRKRAEDELAQANERLTALLRSLPVVVYASAARGKYTGAYVSENVTALTGYRPQDFTENRSFWTDRIHPEDARRVLAESARLLIGENHQVEYRWRVADGSYRWFRDVMHLVRAPKEEADHIVGTWEDITERKNEQEALRVSQERLEAVVSNAPIVLWVADKQGIITLYTGKAVDALGRKPGELVGQSVFSIFTPTTPVGADMQRALAGETFSSVIKTRGRALDARYSPVRDEKGEVVGVIGVATDVTDRVRSEEKVQRQMERLEALHTIDMAITASLDLHVPLRIILEQVTTHLRPDAADVLLLNPATQTLTYAAGRGFRARDVEQTRLRVGEGCAGRVALDRGPVCVVDLRKAEECAQRLSLAASEGFVTYVGVPLVSKGRILGVLETYHRIPFEPDEEWMRFLDALAIQTAVAIDEATLYNDLHRANVDLTLAYDTTLAGWARALELRDYETAGHSRRVCEMSERVAKAMGLSDTEIAHAHRGTLLHDIGKLAIPDSVLLKPGPLTEEEWVVIRKHPQYAYDLLSDIPYLRPALDIPYCHHERWDGAGYPRGLEREQIPLGARIFTAVDVWDALMQARPYKRAWPEEQVLEYLRSQAGAHFDPKVVDVFLQLC
ncbi:MAG: PAS domain-containing protein [Chloroflexi bacterium]|nr:PAS domain-containing protein [Chloroflexota bacterium]